MTECLVDAYDAALFDLDGVIYLGPVAVEGAVGAMASLEARGKRVDEMYRFIYWQSWRQLSADAQQVLALMPLFAQDGASLASMSADRSAVVRIRADVLLRVQELTEPEQKVERLRFSDVAGVGKTLSSEDEIKELLDQLGDRLRKLIAAGVKVVLE